MNGLNGDGAGAGPRLDRGTARHTPSPIAIQGNQLAKYHVSFDNELQVLNPMVFRECTGWVDAGSIAHFGKDHEKHFLIPALESLMPPQVPVRKRCDSCVLALRRYKKHCRIRKYRSSKFNLTKIEWWNNVLQMYARSEIRLSEGMLSKMKVEIQRNGGKIWQLTP